MFTDSDIQWADIPFQYADIQSFNILRHPVCRYSSALTSKAPTFQCSDIQSPRVQTTPTISLLYIPIYMYFDIKYRSPSF